MNKNKGVNGKYSYDDDEDYVPTKKVKYSKNEDSSSVKIKKHTLDSDEEDDDTACGGDDDDDFGETSGNQQNMLQSDEVDGQEERTIDFEGETTITPFNMKEEMEDGHFDKDGYYHFKKDDNIKDAWLDDIDWIKVKRDDAAKNKYGSDIESDEDMAENESNDVIKIYIEIFSHLKPGETVSRALKRLGGNKRISSAQKWKMKKMGVTAEGSEDSMKIFLELTELANKIIETGNMDIYQETYEMINLKIERSKAPPPTTTEQPSMDMFAGEETSTGKDEKKDESDKIAEVKWRFRWKNEDGEEMHGPFTSEEMLKWQKSGYFNKGVYVQKTSETSGDWYTSKRIDFELYI